MNNNQGKGKKQDKANDWKLCNSRTETTEEKVIWKPNFESLSGSGYRQFATDFKKIYFVGCPKFSKYE